jgi:hypothetical protein
MTIAGPASVDTNLQSLELDSRSGSSPSLPTASRGAPAAADMRDANDFRLDSTGTTLNDSRHDSDWPRFTYDGLYPLPVDFHAQPAATLPTVNSSLQDLRAMDSRSGSAPILPTIVFIPPLPYPSLSPIGMESPLALGNPEALAEGPDDLAPVPSTPQNRRVKNLRRLRDIATDSGPTSLSEGAKTQVHVVRRLQDIPDSFTPPPSANPSPWKGYAKSAAYRRL